MKLNESQFVGDSLADLLMSEIHTYVERPQDIYQVIDNLVEGNFKHHLSQEAIIRLERMSLFPDWIDVDKIKMGSSVFDRYSIPIVFILLSVSLPTLYASYPGIEILAITRQMDTQIERRISYTAKFILNIMSLNAFGINGDGIKTVQKIRLLHSYVRHSIRLNPVFQTTYYATKGTTPINQAEMLFTLVCFSSLPIRSMLRIGIPVKDDDIDAYLHLWRVIGFLMGINDEIMPSNFYEFEELYTLISKNYFRETKDGKDMTKSLIHFMYNYTPFIKTIPTDWMRYWLGNTISDLLGIPKYSFFAFFIHLQSILWVMLGILSGNYYARSYIIRMNKIVIYAFLRRIDQSHIP